MLHKKEAVVAARVQESRSLKVQPCIGPLRICCGTGPPPGVLPFLFMSLVLLHFQLCPENSPSLQQEHLDSDIHERLVWQLRVLVTFLY